MKTTVTAARRPGTVMLIACATAVPLLAACSTGADDATSEPAATSVAEEAPASGSDEGASGEGERIDYTGASEARATFDGAELAFVGDGTADGGWCVQTADGVLEVDLQLATIDGADVGQAGGPAELDLDIPLAGSSTLGGALLIVAGTWLAGDTPANVMGVDTPAVTLIADGATVSGSQEFAAGVGTEPNRTVELEVVCR